MLQERDAPTIPILFFRLLEPSQLEDRVTLRGVGPHAAPQVVLDVHRQMALELVVELTQGARATTGTERGREPEQRRTQRSHDEDSSGVMKRARIAVACSQDRASFSICRRPARVSL